MQTVTFSPCIKTFHLFIQLSSSKLIDIGRRLLIYTTFWNHNKRLISKLTNTKHKNSTKQPKRYNDMVIFFWNQNKNPIQNFMNDKSRFKCKTKRDYVHHHIFIFWQTFKGIFFLLILYSPCMWNSAAVTITKVLRVHPLNCWNLPLCWLWIGTDERCCGNTRFSFMKKELLNLAR